MGNIVKGQVFLPAREINKIIYAYNVIGDFLDTFIDRKILYKEEFIQGIDKSLKEVLNRQTKSIKNFSDLNT